MQELGRMENEIFGESAYTLTQLEEMLKDSKYHIYSYMENDDKIKGYIILIDSYDCYEIMKIGVKNNFRREGIGGKILEYIVTNYKKDIFLEVREKNYIAREFYKKNKFKEIGKRKNYYGDGETAILMSISN